MSHYVKWRRFKIYPVLFEYGSFRIDTYSVIWFAALLIAILWSIKRLKLYGVDEDEARSVMSWSFIFMLLGARAPEYIENIKLYMADPSLFLDLQRGSLHEVSAITGAFISALVLCFFRRKKISFLRLCEVAAIPAMLSIAIGRWGCFMNGCCYGLRSTCIFAVHFPRDAVGITRHPTQIYYSVIAFINVLILIFVEKKIFALKRKDFYSVIAPLSLILYALMRIGIDYFRSEHHNFSYTTACVIIPICLIWLVMSLRKIFIVNNS